MATRRYFQGNRRQRSTRIQSGEHLEWSDGADANVLVRTLDEEEPKLFALSVQDEHDVAVVVMERAQILAWTQAVRAFVEEA